MGGPSTCALISLRSINSESGFLGPSSLSVAHSWAIPLCSSFLTDVAVHVASRLDLVGVLAPEWLVEECI